jgi:hypothetical protein
LALLAFLGVFAYAAQSESAALTAQFEGELHMVEDAPALQFSGTILITEERMKIEVQQQATMEQITILVDFKEGLLTTLFPDTLNGKRYSLDEFDHLQGFARIREALSGRQPELPDGWKETASSDAELDGQTGFYRSALSPGGLAVELWTNNDNQPIRAVAQQNSMQVTINMHDYSTVEHADESAFLIPEDYTISDAEGDAPAGLPQL